MEDSLPIAAPNSTGSEAFEGREEKEEEEEEEKRETSVAERETRTLRGLL